MFRNTRYRFIGLALIQTRRLKLKSQLSLQCGIEIVKKCCDTVSVIRQKGIKRAQDGRTVFNFSVQH